MPLADLQMTEGVTYFGHKVLPTLIEIFGAVGYWARHCLMAVGLFMKPSGSLFFTLVGMVEGSMHSLVLPLSCVAPGFTNKGPA